MSCYSNNSTFGFASFGWHGLPLEDSSWEDVTLLCDVYGAVVLDLEDNVSFELGGNVRQQQSDEIQDMLGKRRSTREKKPPVWIKDYN
ncbi:hypothetical protein Patl1_15796 [Pistacia atlantica]|uniref:Uncharacterized protein n=1 Tax=Pistacia atlantica TaxID=434234 RepID=A0ACC1BB61_9ROSI|nr:hypothetical protein Patl1_15796 [Pistacia atlantica]